MRYLTVAEAERLINACEPDFRALVRAGLETGCRYGELTRLEVCDFNPDASTLAIRQSKSGKPRHVVLTEEGAAFFRRHCAGRSGHELMFRHGDGGAWQKSEQARPMAEACRARKIKPAISFHILRHTWASLAVMNGVPLLVVAKNLGHTDTPHGREALRPSGAELHRRCDSSRCPALPRQGRQAGGAVAVSRSSPQQRQKVWARPGSGPQTAWAASARAGLSKVQSVDQRMRLECGVGFRQLRTCRRIRPGQLCARKRHSSPSHRREPEVV